MAIIHAKDSNKLEKIEKPKPKQPVKTKIPLSSATEGLKIIESQTEEDVDLEFLRHDK